MQAYRLAEPQCLAEPDLFDEAGQSGLVAITRILLMSLQVMGRRLQE
jgi:hypothetical protein